MNLRWRLMCFLALGLTVGSSGILEALEPGLVVPGIIAERWQITNGATTRVSLFDNRVAVVSVRDKGVVTFFRQTTLSAGDFGGYVAAMMQDIEVLESGDYMKTPQGGDLDCRLRFRTSSGSIRELGYSTFAVTDLPVSRLLAALDAVEKLVRETLPGEETLKSWEPKVGDVVELRAGGLAKVVDVREDGLIELEHLEVGIIEMVILELRARTILRVVQQ